MAGAVISREIKKENEKMNLITDSPKPATTPECFFCGVVHTSVDCKPEDLEAVRLKIEAKNKCGWCGFYSEKSVMHSKCEEAMFKEGEKEYAWQAHCDALMAEDEDFQRLRAYEETRA